MKSRTIEYGAQKVLIRRYEGGILYNLPRAYATIQEGDISGRQLDYVSGETIGNTLITFEDNKITHVLFVCRDLDYKYYAVIF